MALIGQFATCDQAPVRCALLPPTTPDAFVSVTSPLPRSPCAEDVAPSTTGSAAATVGAGTWSMPQTMAITSSKARTRGCTEHTTTTSVDPPAVHRADFCFVHSSRKRRNRRCEGNPRNLVTMRGLFAYITDPRVAKICYKTQHDNRVSRT